MRDWCAVNITLKKGFQGAKPRDFVHWVMEVLNVQPGDEFVDLFHGSGAVKEAIETFYGFRKEAHMTAGELL